MGLWTKGQLRAFIKENKLVTAQDAQNALKELFAETIQEMLESKLDTHLGYEKHDIQAKKHRTAAMGKVRRSSSVSMASRKSRSPGIGWGNSNRSSCRSIKRT